jgi:2-hydroxycyclohexanecarboxyl-CoA dehydrogenase
VSGGKVAIVTGAAGGIGLGCARRLAKDGYRVAMLDLQEDLLQKEVDSLKAGGADVLAFTADVSKRGDIDAAYAAVRKAWGPISIVVANAGIGGTQAFATMTVEQWQRMIDINLTGVFHTIQPAVAEMVEQKWGRIVTISSQAGQSGGPLRSHYSAAKAGVIGLTKALARELGKTGVTVNTIPPSVVDTPLAQREFKSGESPGTEYLSKIVPQGRAGTPDDIAGACAFLCSDDAAYITGQQINVNGGMYM